MIIKILLKFKLNFKIKLLIKSKLLALTKVEKTYFNLILSEIFKPRIP